MPGRVLILLRARIAAQREGAAFPVGAMMMQGAIAALLCGLVYDLLPPFGYAVFALSISAALVAVPLLGELSDLLRADEAEEWIRTLPATDTELRIARLLHLLLALGTLSLAALLPAGLLTPAGPGGKLTLIAGGLGQVLFLAAALLLIQSILRGRAQALLVVVQTALFLAVVVGSTVVLRHVPTLCDIASPAAAGPLLAFFPPAWFAAPLAADAGGVWAWAAPVAALASALVLVMIPPPPRETVRRGQPLLSRMLSPLRTLAAGVWVHPDERGTFDLVFDALPQEREFVLRSYPLIAVPLAFLVVGARGEETGAQEGLLALLLFTPGAWLPILLMHVPASGSHEARWLLDTAPVSEVAVAGGALKAIAVRFVVPLYALLGLLAFAFGGADLAARLVPPAFLTAIVVLRFAWGMCVEDKPLSIDPSSLKVELNLGAVLGTFAFVLTVVAIAAHALLTSVALGLAATVVLIVVERLLDRSWRAKGVWTG